MASASIRIDAIKNWTTDHRKPLMAAFAAIAVIVLIVGLSLMWFVSNKSLSTVGKIQTPATLKVLGPNQSAIEQIDISYSEAMKDTVGENGIATIRRGFCVQSNGSDFELQIANTSNISGLQIKVYRVANANAKAENATIAGVSGTTTYSWQIGKEVTGFELINPAKAGDESLAKGLEAKGDPTFDNYKNVQKNARPLYRFKRFSAAGDDTSKLYGAGDANGVATNFIIECSWQTRPNVKEADVVYLIARNAGNAN